MARIGAGLCLGIRYSPLTMSYKAIVCCINTSPLPKADHIQIASARGYTCVIGVDHADGELGILFPEGGQLAHSFCMANKLYRKDPETGEEMGGYLDENRRVRTLKLMGVESNALWLPIDSVYTWLEGVGVYEWFALEDAELDVVAGKALCGKYYTQATIRMARSKDHKERKDGAKGKALDLHYDTGKLRSARLPKDGRVYITEKLHGTSGRTGNVPVEQEHGWLAKQLNRLPGVNIKPKSKYMLVTGSRKRIIETAGSLSFRARIHDMFVTRGSALGSVLEEDEVWYYEIVGFEETGAPIMGTHGIGKIGDTKVEKRLKAAVKSATLVYHYGCAPDGSMPCHLALDSEVKRFKIYVYRITTGGADLPFLDMVNRVNRVCLSLCWSGCGRYIDVVPLAGSHEPGTWSEGALRDQCDKLTREPSTLPNMPIREGVCVRFEPEKGGQPTVLKHKSWVFCALEGIARNDPGFVDAEEVS